MAAEERAELLLLFDGVCNLCNGTVRFVIERDPSGLFRFASLQSEAGRARLRQHGLAEDALESLVLVEGGRCYTRSGAALRVARRLGFPWSLLYGLIVLPRPIRDALYDFVARNRYRWFGKTEVCQLPSPELSRRFLG